MKTRIFAGDFAKALAAVAGTVDRRSLAPILSCVRLDLFADELTIAGTDPNQWTSAVAPCESLSASGAAIVPARDLLAFVKSIDRGSSLVCSLENGVFRVESGNGSSTFPTLPLEDWPAPAAHESASSFSIPAPLLLEVFDKVATGISTEETHYYLNGVFLHMIESGGAKKLRFVTTDGHRLMRFEIDAPASLDKLPPVIIPRKAVSEIRKLLKKQTGAVEISVCGKSTRFVFAGVELQTKNIDGSFPDYARVIPTRNDKLLTVSRKAFVENVKRVSSGLSKNSDKAVRMSIAPGKISLCMIDPERGDRETSMPASFNAPPLEIGFDGRYVLDILAALSGLNVETLFENANSPTIFADPDDSRLLCVLMPMRI